MNIGQVIQKCLDAYAAFTAGNKLQAGLIILGVLQAILSAMPTVGAARAVVMHASGKCYDDMTTEELFEELQNCCAPHMAAQATMTGPAEGSIIDTILPILTALLKKLLGL